MKTIITLLTATVLVAGATTAMAYDRQGSDEAAGNELSWKSGAFGGAYGAARGHGGTHNSTIYVPAPYDFQAEGSR